MFGSDAPRANSTRIRVNRVFGTHRWLAWWIWGLAHVYFLISFRNRMMVTTQWMWAYVNFERGARLITGTRARPESDGTGRHTDSALAPDGQKAA